LFSLLSHPSRHFSLKPVVAAADPQIVARQSKTAAENLRSRTGAARGERLRPIRKVVRELTRPDGTTVRVEVPVYPPFQLKDRSKSKTSETGE